MIREKKEIIKKLEEKKMKVESIFNRNKKEKP